MKFFLKQKNSLEIIKSWKSLGGMSAKIPSQCRKIYHKFFVLELGFIAQNYDKKFLIVNL